MSNFVRAIDKENKNKKISKTSTSYRPILNWRHLSLSYELYLWFISWKYVNSYHCSWLLTHWNLGGTCTRKNHLYLYTMRSHRSYVCCYHTHWCHYRQLRLQNSQDYSCKRNFPWYYYKKRLNGNYSEYCSSIRLHRGIQLRPQNIQEDNNSGASRLNSYSWRLHGNVLPFSNIRLYLCSVCRCLHTRNYKYNFYFL